MAETVKKYRRTRPRSCKKWAKEEIDMILDYIQQTPVFEKPTAQQYYRAFLSKHNIDVTWDLVRWKVRSLRLSLIKAIEWQMTPAAVELVHIQDGLEQIQTKINRMCPFYARLHEIFNVQSVKPTQICETINITDSEMDSSSSSNPLHIEMPSTLVRPEMVSMDAISTKPTDGETTSPKDAITTELRKYNATATYIFPSCELNRMKMENMCVERETEQVQQFGRGEPPMQRMEQETHIQQVVQEEREEREEQQEHNDEEDMDEYEPSEELEKQNEQEEQNRRERILKSGRVSDIWEYKLKEKELDIQERQLKIKEEKLKFAQKLKIQEFQKTWQLEEEKFIFDKEIKLHESKKKIQREEEQLKFDKKIKLQESEKKIKMEEQKIKFEQQIKFKKLELRKLELDLKYKPSNVF